MGLRAPSSATSAEDGFVPPGSRAALQSTLLTGLDELRRRLVLGLASLAVVFVVCFSFSEELYRFLMAPVRQALPSGALIVATKVPEVFLLHVRISFLASVLFTAPLWLYHGWRLLVLFHPRGKVTGFASIAALGAGLFFLGAAFGHYVLFPYGVRFLTNFGSDSVHVMLSVGMVFSLYSRFVIGIGAAFQIPTGVFVLSKLGLVTPRLLARQWKLVVLGAFVLAAVITPTPDLITQSLLAFPLIALYVASIGVCWLVRR
ncbi:MAG TPA: twin-arginine translocase subunit TatC [Vicinamibacteria bacterium]|nr:twin-arginine translocase subunit TatC [Vicinamibacteria bacterium]